MKTIIFLFALVSMSLFLTSCESVDNVGVAGLEDDEEEYLRSLERTKCFAEIARDIDIFEKDANNFSSFTRGNRWTVTKKLVQGTTNTTENNTVYIWKISGDYIYLLIQKPNTDNLITNTFLRVSKEENLWMINDLKLKICDHNTYKNLMGESSSSTFKITNEYRENSTGGNINKVKATYSYSVSDTPYFGRFRYTMDKNEIHPDGSATSTKPTSISSKMSSRDTHDEFPTTGDVYTEYDRRRYCVVKIDSGMGTEAMPYVYSFPYTEDSLNCTETSADGTGPTGGTITINAWPNPGTDLTL